MDRKEEIRNILRAEIILAAKDLLYAKGDESFEKALEKFDDLYRKIAAYRYLSAQGDEGWEEIFRSPEPVRNPEEKSAASPFEPSTDEIAQPPADPPTFERHMDTYRRSARTRFEPKSPRRLPPLNIGLADKIAFVRHLFDGDEEAYSAFTARVEEAPTYEDALHIVREFKSRYDWEGKDEYEFRLLQLIHAKYAR
ncbi:MAG: hypothetical protein GXO27_03825 [Chlorobi bacterium]|nr:hypothetical protein [Chlorobiota bacterium]